MKILLDANEHLKCKEVRHKDTIPPMFILSDPLWSLLPCKCLTLSHCTVQRPVLRPAVRALVRGHPQGGPWVVHRDKQAAAGHRAAAVRPHGRSFQGRRLCDAAVEAPRGAHE